MMTFQTIRLRTNMERHIRRQVIKGSIAYGALFSLSFILHIIFAAKDFHIGFQIIAALITFMNFFGGILIIYFVKIKSYRVNVNRFAAFISVFLALGLGWAYAGMMMHWSIILWPFGTVLSHMIVEKFVLDEHHDLK